MTTTNRIAGDILTVCSNSIIPNEIGSLWRVVSVDGQIMMLDHVTQVPGGLLQGDCSIGVSVDCPDLMFVGRAR